MKDGLQYSYGGKYKVLRPLAEGGMGSVYLAEQLGIMGFSKTVAIKVIKKEWTARSLFRKLLIDEAKLVADLIHENILQVYHLADFDGACGIVMEFIHGCTLDDINERLDQANQYMPPDLATFVISRVARALHYAHTKTGREGGALHIVHRDVSPPNVMVSWEGVVKLSDFGIAKARDMHSPDDKDHVVGKVPFLSPEQVAMQGADPRSDIYSLGLVWYELLSGRTAFPAEELDELKKLHRNGNPDSVRTFNPRIPEEMESIMLKMISPDPAQRFQDAREVVNTLETYLYSKGYGPTNEKLRDYLIGLFPEVEKKRIIADQQDDEVLFFRPTLIQEG